MTEKLYLVTCTYHFNGNVGLVGIFSSLEAAKEEAKKWHSVVIQENIELNKLYGRHADRDGIYVPDIKLNV